MSDSWDLLILGKQWYKKDGEFMKKKLVLVIYSLTAVSFDGTQKMNYPDVWYMISSHSNFCPVIPWSCSFLSHSLAGLKVTDRPSWNLILQIRFLICCHSDSRHFYNWNQKIFNPQNIYLFYTSTHTVWDIASIIVHFPKDCYTPPDNASSLHVNE